MSKILSADTKGTVTRWQVPDVTLGGGGDYGTSSNKYLTAVQLERIQKQAYNEAFTRGLKEGVAAGQAQVREQAQVFLKLSNSLQNPLKQIDERTENEIVLMCLAIAKQIIRREITLDSGHIISVIREALEALPIASQKVRVLLHPDDAILVRNITADSNEEVSWKIIDDITLSRGGCKVITENSHIDATLESRLAMIASKILVDERSNSESE